MIAQVNAGSIRARDGGKSRFMGNGSLSDFQMRAHRQHLLVRMHLMAVFLYMTKKKGMRNRTPLYVYGLVSKP